MKNLVQATPFTRSIPSSIVLQSSQTLIISDTKITMHFQAVFTIFSAMIALSQAAALLEERNVNGCRANNCARQVAGTGGAAGPIGPRVTACSSYIANPVQPVPAYASNCDTPGEYSSACSCLLASQTGNAGVTTSTGTSTTSTSSTTTSTGSNP